MIFLYALLNCKIEIEFLAAWNVPFYQAAFASVWNVHRNVKKKKAVWSSRTCSVHVLVSQSSSLQVVPPRRMAPFISPTAFDPHSALLANASQHPFILFLLLKKESRTSIPQLRLKEGSSSWSFFLKAQGKNFYLCVCWGGRGFQMRPLDYGLTKDWTPGCYDFPASPFPVSWNLTMCHTLINTHKPLRASCSLWCNCRLTSQPPGHLANKDLLSSNPWEHNPYVIFHLVCKSP